MAEKRIIRKRGGSARFRLPALVLLMMLSFIPGRLSRGETMTGEMLTEKLLRICETHELTDGAVWEEIAEGEQDPGRAFAAYLAEQLFERKFDEAEWEKLPTPPLVKARGIRAGDILRCGGQSAMILSVSPAGEIRTIECADGEEPVVRVNGYFAGNPENARFEGIASAGNFEYVLRSPMNTSDPVWSARLEALPEKPAVIGAKYPVYLSNDQFFGLRGTVACKYRLLEVRARVTNRVTGEVLFNVAVRPNDTVYRIGNPTDEPINDGLVFNSPECANSYLNYSLTVTVDQEGQQKTQCILSQNFTVGNPQGEEPEEQGE